MTDDNKDDSEVYINRYMGIPNGEEAVEPEVNKVSLHSQFSPINSNISIKNPAENTQTELSINDTVQQNVSPPFSTTLVLLQQILQTVASFQTLVIKVNPVLIQKTLLNMRGILILPARYQILNLRKNQIH